MWRFEGLEWVLEFARIFGPGKWIWVTGYDRHKMVKAIYHYINTVVVGHFRVEIPSRKNYGVNFNWEFQSKNVLYSVILFRPEFIFLPIVSEGLSTSIIGMREKMIRVFIGINLTFYFRTILRDTKNQFHIILTLQSSNEKFVGSNGIWTRIFGYL